MYKKKLYMRQNIVKRENCAGKFQYNNSICDIAMRFFNLFS